MSDLESQLEKARKAAEQSAMAFGLFTPRGHRLQAHLEYLYHVGYRDGLEDALRCATQLQKNEEDMYITYTSALP